MGKSKLVEVSGKIIALFHRKEGWFALDDRCPHRGGPLSEGVCSEGKVTCPWHHAQFELKTGHCLSPKVASVKAYPLRIENGEIEVGLE